MDDTMEAPAPEAEPYQPVYDYEHSLDDQFYSQIWYPSEADALAAHRRHRTDVIGAILALLVLTGLVVGTTTAISHLLVAESRDHRANVQARSNACLKLSAPDNQLACLKTIR